VKQFSASVGYWLNVGGIAESINPSSHYPVLSLDPAWLWSSLA
jgi:hypothetical protein